MRILILDDVHPNVRQIEKSFNSIDCYSIATASTATEGVLLSSAVKFDLLVVSGALLGKEKEISLKDFNVNNSLIYGQRKDQLGLLCTPSEVRLSLCCVPERLVLKEFVRACGDSSIPRYGVTYEKFAI